MRIQCHLNEIVSGLLGCAKVEIAAAAGRIRVTPFPVERADSRKWYKSADRAKRLFQEYSKLLLAYTRGRGSEVNPPQLSEVPEN